MPETSSAAPKLANEYNREYNRSVQAQYATTQQKLVELQAQRQLEKARNAGVTTEKYNADLEKRLDLMLKEIEELKRAIHRQGGPATSYVPPSNYKAETIYTPATTYVPATNYKVETIYTPAATPPPVNDSSPKTAPAPAAVPAVPSYRTSALPSPKPLPASAGADTPAPSPVSALPTVVDPVAAVPNVADAPAPKTITIPPPRTAVPTTPATPATPATPRTRELEKPNES